MGNNPRALGVLLGVLAALGSGAPSARASGDGDCGRLLLTRDEGLAAYVGDLLEEGVLGTAELEAWRSALEEGRVENPVTEDVARTNWEAQVHREPLGGMVEGGGLDAGFLLEWAEARLAGMERNAERRAVVREETRELGLGEALPGAVMVPLEGGRFTMGSPGGERGRYGDEGRVPVEVSPFGMMETPVTQRQWYEVMGGNPSHFSGKEHCKKSHLVLGGVGMCPDHPVENVSWDDVQKFHQRLNGMLGIAEPGRMYRLPTEAEWEYAARAGTGTAYWFGDDARKLGEHAWYGENSGGKTRPVGLKPPNPWGLRDMHGNVWEWTQDYYGRELPGGKDPLRGSGANRVIRGGGWDDDVRSLRSASRIFDDAVNGDIDMGFRSVRTK